MSDNEAFAKSWQDEINEALADAQLTQAELARRLGVDAQTVHRWASKGQLPRLSMLPRLRQLLHHTRTGTAPIENATSQWLFDRATLLDRYRLASEIWIIKTGKALLSQEDGEAKKVIGDIVLDNLAARAGGSSEKLKQVNFLVANEDTAHRVGTLLGKAWDELFEGEAAFSLVLDILGISKGAAGGLRKAQARAIHGLMPQSLQMGYTFQAARSVMKTLDDYLLKASPDYDEADLQQAVRDTVKLYAFENILELWAMGLGFDDTGIVYLKYPKAPSPEVSELLEEVLIEIDVREAVKSADNTIQSNPRSIWIRPRDRAILDRSERISLVIEVIRARGACEVE